jgi:hypothetical protein
MNEKEYLLAKAELSTYLDGLCDALNMTKPEIRKAINFLAEHVDDMGDVE